MFTRRTAALAPALALALVGRAAAAQQLKWVTVSPLQADFLVEMPGQPRRIVDGRVTKYNYAVAPNTPGAVYTGVAVESPIPLGEATDSLLQREVVDFTQALGSSGGDCRVASKTRRDYAPDRPGQPTYRGTLARVECNDARALFVAYVVGWKVYAATYAAKKARYSDAEADRFIRSFALLRR